jgi:hypothetical protein
MNVPGKRRSATFDRKRAIARHFTVLAIYRFFSLFLVGIMPLVAHALISMQTEAAETRAWVAPELWLLSLVMWGSTLAESLAQESAGLRRYFISWGGLFGVFGSAYAYGSLMVHAPAAKALNEVFQRWPVHATTLAVFAFMILHYHDILAKAAQDVGAEEQRT